MLVWEDVAKNFQKFLLYGLQDIRVWIDKNPFFWPCKKQGSSISQGHICIKKNVHVGGASLDSYFKAIWLHAWKISNHLELYSALWKAR